MSWGAVAGAAISVVGGQIMGGGAEDAAGAQGAATAGQIGEQRRQFDLTRADNSQYQNTGSAASARLAHLLGVGPGSSAARQSAETRIKALLPNWNFAGTADVPAEVISAGMNILNNPQLQQEWGYDQKHLDALREAIATARSATSSGGPSDGEEGSLLRKFSAADMEADPVYQSGLDFGLKTGTGAINARAIAGGGYDSGATLKALTRYGNDYGSTKANESYNRYTSDQSNIYNKLSGTSGAGQVANQQVQAAGMNMANNVSGYMGDAGNARAAGIVGGSNAWGGALTGIGKGMNSYLENERLKKLYPQNGYGSASSNPYGGWTSWGE